MAVLEINRNDINWSMCPMYPTCTRHERMKPIVFCYWDLHQHEKWMPPSPNWDGLPVGRHFQNGHQWSEITFSSMTQQSLFWEMCSVLQGHNYLLESDDGITINRDIWAVFGPGRDIHISTALYCAYTEKAPKHLWCKGVWTRHVYSHWYIFIHSLLETSGY